MKNNVKEECIRRLNMLIEQGVLTDINVLKLFNEGELCISVANLVMGKPCGIIFPLTSQRKYYDILENDIRSELRMLECEPYFIMLQNTSLGLLMSVLYVSSECDQWETEREALAEYSPRAYVYNVDDDFGEIGDIEYSIVNGGPIRTA